MREGLKQALYDHLEELKHQEELKRPLIKKIFERRLQEIFIEENEAKNNLYDQLEELKHQEELIKDLRESIEEYEYEQGVIADFLFPIITEQQEEAEEAYDERREEEEEEDNK